MNLLILLVRRFSLFANALHLLFFTVICKVITGGFFVKSFRHNTDISSDFGNVASLMKNTCVRMLILLQVFIDDRYSWAC